MNATASAILPPALRPAAPRWSSSLAAALMTALGVAAAPASAQPYELGPRSGYLMDREAEIALARSAGPPEVGAEATILVLEDDGTYERAVVGTNGFTCFVGRAWTGPARVVEGRRVLQEYQMSPTPRAPQCFNELGASSVLAWHELTTRLLFEGRDTDEVEDAVQTALERGTLEAPAPGAMSYMLSPDQYLNDRVGRFRPHLMFYTPRATGRELYGVEGLDTTGLPFVTDEGGPWAVTTVVVSRFSDGTIASPPRD